MEPGQVLAGRFQIESVAGQGGAGTIYKARDLRAGCRVAVKVVRGAGHLDHARFAREAKVLSQIEHPALVQYLDHGTASDGTPYLVMEWLEGEDLRTRLGRQSLTFAETVLLGRRVAKVLALLHSCGLVHRDVKPGNLLVVGGNPADVKLLDLGLVRTGIEDKSSLTHTGLAIGTPGYMAPEQARGQKDIGPRADLFSLGCVLYRCLTGKAPFEGAHLIEVMTKVLLDEPPDLAVVCPTAPVRLTSLVHAMLRKDPEQRPASAAEVAAQLEEITLFDDSATLPPGPVSARPRGLTSVERRLVSVILVGPAAAPAAASEGTPAEVLAALRVVARAHGAVVEQMAGDVQVVHLAGSGMPVDDAARAARCALSIRTALPAVPISLSTGRSEMTGRAPVGDAIERATALLAEEHQGLVQALLRNHPLPAWIAVDAVTAQLVQAHFDVREVQGSFRLCGVLPGAASSRTVLGKEIPMFGRDWETGTILGAFQSAVDEPAARAVLVTGPAGAGKSRLAREVLTALRRLSPDVEIWHAAAVASAEGSPLRLLASVLKSALGLQAGLSAEAQQERLLERVGQRLESERAGRVAEQLAELTQIALDTPPSAALRAARADPRILGERTREAWETFLAASCSAHPVVIVLEDLQWGDVPSTRLLGEALGRLRDLPWMILAFGRPDVASLFPGLWQQHDCQQVRLRPLTKKAAEQLVRHVLGAEIPAEVVSRIVLQAEGNAFFLEELLIAFATRGTADQSTLPETVLAVVQARLAQIDADARRVLRAASILGDVFWTSAVEVLLGRGGSWSASLWVDSLVAQEILVRCPQSRFEGEPEVAFRHALLREGAYAMLTDDDRALGHKLAGEWLAHKGESDPLVLARHFELGCEPARAASHYAAAGELALRGMDLGAAASLANKARALDVEGALGGRCQVILAEASLWQSRWEDVAAHANETLKTAAIGGELWMRAMSMKQSAAFSLGHFGELLETIVALMSSEIAPEARAVSIQAFAVAVFVLCLGAQMSIARGLLVRLDRMVAETCERQLVPLGWASFAHGVLEGWGSGDAWTALRYFEAARADFDEAGDRQHSAFVRVFMAIFHMALGAFDRAEDDLSQIPADLDPRSLVGSSRDDQRTLLELQRGRFDVVRARAAPLLALADTDNSADFMRAGQAHQWLGDIAFREGDYAVAERELSTAVTILRLTPTLWPRAALSLARAYLRQNKPDRALASAEEVVHMVDSQGFEILGPLARLVHAEALLALGNAAAAQATLARGAERLLEVAARIDDSGVRTAYLAMPDNARLLELFAACPPQGA